MLSVYSIEEVNMINGTEFQIWIEIQILNQIF